MKERVRLIFVWNSEFPVIDSIFSGVQSTDYENYDNNYENLTFEDSSEGTDNKTEIEDNDELLPGFGSAHMFMPIPNSGTVVAAHCGWQFRYNFVPNRVPRRFCFIFIIISI